MIRSRHHGPIGSLLSGSLLAISVFFAVAPQAAMSQPSGDILRTTKRILSEERRQLDAQRRVNALVRRIDWLLEDLESNGFTPETAGGGKYDKARDRLLAVGNTRVPRAVILLRNARSDLTKAFPNLVRADLEIEGIVRQLDEAVGDAGASLLLEVVLRELRHIIKQQEFLNRQTRFLVKNENASKADYERIVKAEDALSWPTGDLVRLLSEGQSQVDEATGKRFAAAGELVRTTVDSMRSLQGLADSAWRPFRINSQGVILDRLRKAERILTSEEMNIDELIPSLRQLLEEQIELKQEVEASDVNQLNAQRKQLQLRQIDVVHGVNYWLGFEQAKGGPMETELIKAHAASDRARHFMTWVSSEDAKAKVLVAQTEAIDALKRALAEAEKKKPKTPGGDINVDLQGEGEDGKGERAAEAAGLEALGLDPDEPEDGSEEQGEEQTAGGIEQRDTGLGDAEEPPKDGEPVEDASGSEGKPGDPGPSVYEGKGGPIGGAKLEESGDHGLSIDPNSESKRHKMTNAKRQELEQAVKGRAFEEMILSDWEPPSTGYTLGNPQGKRARGAQARDAASARRRSAMIKKYVQQLPPEFRQQVADYYEALAK